MSQPTIFSWIDSVLSNKDKFKVSFSGKQYSITGEILTQDHLVMSLELYQLNYNALLILFAHDFLV